MDTLPYIDLKITYKREYINYRSKKDRTYKKEIEKQGCQPGKQTEKQIYLQDYYRRKKKRSGQPPTGDQFHQVI